MAYLCVPGNHNVENAFLCKKCNTIFCFQCARKNTDRESRLPACPKCKNTGLDDSIIALNETANETPKGK